MTGHAGARAALGRHEGCARVHQTNLHSDDPSSDTDSGAPSDLIGWAWAAGAVAPRPTMTTQAGNANSTSTFLTASGLRSSAGQADDSAHTTPMAASTASNTNERTDSTSLGISQLHPPAAASHCETVTVPREHENGGVQSGVLTQPAVAQGAPVVKVGTAAAAASALAVKIRNVYVAALPMDFTDADLSELLSQFGKLKSCRMFNEAGRVAEIGRAYGFALFEDAAAAEAAVAALDGKPFRNARLQCRLSRNGVVKRPSVDEQRPEVAANNKLGGRPTAVSATSNAPAHAPHNDCAGPRFVACPVVSATRPTSYVVHDPQLMAPNGCCYYPPSPLHNAMFAPHSGRLPAFAGHPWPTYNTLNCQPVPFQPPTPPQLQPMLMAPGVYYGVPSATLLPYSSPPVAAPAMAFMGRPFVAC